MSRTTMERIKNIQRTLGLEEDGIIGGETLSALEKKLGVRPFVAEQAKTKIGLTLTNAGIQQIVDFEIGSIGYYNSKLQMPSWPGGNSGVTIGIGYDLGYQTEAVFRHDWSQFLPVSSINRLIRSCERKGRSAKALIGSLKNISVSYESAYKVFISNSLPVYASRTKSAFPGIESLSPNAQTALVSLVYNRGPSVTGPNRTEMLAIRGLIATKNYSEIANQIESMKRLWLNRGLDGLLKRRDIEAQMVRNTNNSFRAGDLVTV